MNRGRWEPLCYFVLGCGDDGGVWVTGLGPKWAFLSLPRILKMVAKRRKHPSGACVALRRGKDQSRGRHKSGQPPTMEQREVWSGHNKGYITKSFFLFSWRPQAALKFLGPFGARPSGPFGPLRGLALVHPGWVLVHPG